MNHLLKRTLTGGLTLGALLVMGVSGVSFAAPAPQSDEHAQRPPTTDTVSGEQAKPPVEPGTHDAKIQLGATDLVKTDAEGKPLSGDASILAGNVANVDFLAPINYCYRNLVYTPVKNTTATAKSLHIRVYNQGQYRDIYTSVAANSTVYPASYGISGSYTAYLYVWNGSTYKYDELKTGANNCSVAVSRTYNTGGWVQLKIQNVGTAYASQRSTELAPFPTAGTYTGTHVDSPAPGGAAIYRWFWVGTSPYGIVSSTVGSFNAPYLFYGDL
jgi:hypothetical protein